MSTTRWSARVDSVRPIVTRLNQVIQALQLLSKLNLTPETHAVLRGILQYITSYDCLMIGSIWLKVLIAIDNRSRVLQARNATIDIEMHNVESLLEEMKDLRGKWDSILCEINATAAGMDIEQKFTKAAAVRSRRRKRFHDEPAEAGEGDSLQPLTTAEEKFKINVFHVIMDSVIVNLSTRYEAVKSLNHTFSFLWHYPELSDTQLEECCKVFADEYKDDVTLEELRDEMKHLKSIHAANLQPSQTDAESENTAILKPLQLLNKLTALHLNTLFPNCCVALRIFCSIPVTVAEGERSFSCLARIKNCLRSTMCQERLTDLGTLAIESELANSISFSSVIQTFAEKKARKAFIH